MDQKRKLIYICLEEDEINTRDSLHLLQKNIQKIRSTIERNFKQ